MWYHDVYVLLCTITWRDSFHEWSIASPGACWPRRRWKHFPCTFHEFSGIFRLVFSHYVWFTNMVITQNTTYRKVRMSCYRSSVCNPLVKCYLQCTQLRNRFPLRWFCKTVLRCCRRTYRIATRSVSPKKIQTTTKRSAGEQQQHIGADIMKNMKAVKQGGYKNGQSAGIPFWN